MMHTTAVPMLRFAVSGTLCLRREGEVSSVLHDIQVALASSPEPATHGVFGPIRAPKRQLSLPA